MKFILLVCAYVCEDKYGNKKKQWTLPEALGKPFRLSSPVLGG